MAISIVNGFVCTSSCDVAKAKKGEDPHPLTGAAKIAAEKDEKRLRPAQGRNPAVVFGGALAGAIRLQGGAAGRCGGAAGAAAVRTPGSAVNLLV